ncbi:hypothetical protein R5R35_000106 [Gryllus longicercus]|uniref:Cyclin-like domain-containing protein n=1 Tax=Gryllus longicercus TaxID=2509291 RepID=A0AAN9Z5R9_9ORTH
MDQGLSDNVHPLVMQLNEALSLETKFQANLQLPSTTQASTEITTGIRGVSAHVLRCLKVWYDLPSEVLFVAINLMDRFLTKMKARPKYMACIAVSSFHLACKEVMQHRQKVECDSDWIVPDSRDLVTISQCKCTLGDLARMEDIISCKLGAEPNVLPITPLTFLQLFHELFSAAAKSLGLLSFYKSIVDESTMWLCLEIIACDGSCANFRACEVALVLLCTQLEGGVSKLTSKSHHSSGSSASAEVMQLIGFAMELQKICKISESSFFCCHDAVFSILAHYNAECQMPYRQRLVWKLSHRTLRYLRPTDKLTSLLPTIDELRQLQTPSRVRFGSVSSNESWESEKEEKFSRDWDAEEVISLQE